MGAKTVEIKSPNGGLLAKIEDGAQLNYSVFLEGKPLLENCAISMQTDKGNWGANSKIKSSKQTTIDKTEDAPLFIKSKIRDNCTEAVLDFGKFSLIARAYDNAFVFRFIGKGGNNPLIVKSETFELKVPPQATSWVHGCGGVQACFEEEIMTWKVEDLARKFAAGLPYIVQRDGAKIAVLESDVLNFPSIRMVFDKEKKYPVGWHAKVPKTFKIGTFGRTVVADEEEN
ncbi:MAG: glycoside hydrolase family 97 N-terminal domain-containing protein, partial [Opitutales bacterium]|nr:glycoside hydrolase family 97 N-terminal domain-containing protein [Opitutales bacterium]